MTRDEIYGWYKDWCEQTGHKPLARERFLPKFKEQMKGKIANDTRIRINSVPTRVFEFK